MTVDSPESFRLDRTGMRRAFDRASTGYDAAGALQARVRAELLGRLELVPLAPRVVLDLGAGTGLGTRELKRRYRRASVVALDLSSGMLRQARRHSRPFARFARLCGDALRLPLKDASVDLLFSNLMLQWCDDLDGTLAEIRRVLRPEGFFGFSTFGPATLTELRTAWSAADASPHVNLFLDMHDIGSALMRAGLSEPVLDVERVTVTYDDVLALMRDLKAIGAHNVVTARTRGLTGKLKWRTMTASYESFRREGRLPASYEVIYGAAWGARGRPGAAMHSGEAHIAPSAIRRRGSGA
jgi:malonyl-CoA O-methyltransferase